MKVFGVMSTASLNRNNWLLIAGVFVFFLMPEYAQALVGVLCSVVNMFLGQAGRAIATLAIIFLGVGATLGKVSWGLALTVAVGIATMLGAPGILFLITGLSAGC